MEINKWIKCYHKDVLEIGYYVLRLEYNGFNTNKIFNVSEKDKKREIPYFNAVAYFKVPTYEPT